MVLADEPGIVRRRFEPSTSHRVSSQLFHIPRRGQCQWKQTRNVELCNACSAKHQLHIKDGTVHRHGPRDNPCSGLHQPPLFNSMHQHSATRLSETTTSVSDRTAAQGLATSPQHISAVVSTPSIAFFFLQQLCFRS